MNPITHDLIDNLEPHLDSFEEICFPHPSTQPGTILGSPHYIRRIDIQNTDYSVRAAVEFHGVPHHKINRIEDVSDAIATGTPLREQLTIQHYDEPTENPGLWCDFDYTAPKHTITYEEAERGECNLQRKQTTREAYKESQQYLPDVARRSTRAKPEQRLEDTRLVEIIEPQHTFTDEIRNHKEDVSTFLDAYLTHLQR